MELYEKIIQLVLSLLSAIASLALAYLAVRKLWHTAVKPAVFLALTYFVLATTCAAGFVHDVNDPDNLPARDSAPCYITAFLFYTSAMASALWYSIMTSIFWLILVRNWAVERISALLLKQHILVWGLSGIYFGLASVFSSFDPVNTHYCEFSNPRNPFHIILCSVILINILASTILTIYCIRTLHQVGGRRDITDEDPATSMDSKTMDSKEGSRADLDLDFSPSSQSHSFDESLLSSSFSTPALHTAVSGTIFQSTACRLYLIMIAYIVVWTFPVFTMLWEIVEDKYGAPTQSVGDGLLSVGGIVCLFVWSLAVPVYKQASSSTVSAPRSAPV